MGLGFALYAGARLPRVSMVRAEDGDGDTVRVWLQDEAGSAAVAASGEQAWQYGPRGLWDEVVAVQREYADLGSPGADAFGLTVTAAGQVVWLHSPELVIGARC